MSEPTTTPTDFDDLLAANEHFAETFDLAGFDGVAHAGIAIVTCMDSRIAPLAMLGLHPGDAKIFRNPGGRVTPQALEALVLAVHLLNVNRVLVVPHTRCAVASNTEEELQRRVGESAGVDASWHDFNVVTDQQAALEHDVHVLRSHPLIGERALIGGFMYDVDTGRLTRQA
ncbi:carbonic anhydrase [Phycicoccus sp. MAQZ13P-2]|uniref:beta-class carbonic anhydrase n=1 Tax=Phycicoccus mangrovi TaxID=2840470 RepID=UPI001C0016D9|nr:carbonic anhydrase [Phycicoccus mangrovi]MBT9253964.1 carbonic anhydrase [Phycicoccus mangrovi]MBT9275623.1 carbonic anhydrase [Phycicoccus mangrovi]